MHNDLSINTLNYIFIEGSEFAKFYPLRKNHRHLHNVPGSKIKKLGSLPNGAILCTMDVVSLYPSISQGEGLAPVRKFLEARDSKQVSRDTLTELA